MALCERKSLLVRTFDLGPLPIATASTPVVTRGFRKPFGGSMRTFRSFLSCTVFCRLFAMTGGAVAAWATLKR